MRGDVARTVRCSAAMIGPSKVEKREIPDELAHAHGAVLLDPGAVEHEPHEIVPDSIEDEDGPDGLPLPDLRDANTGGGGAGADAEGDGDPDQFVFVDGTPLLAQTTEAGPRAERFDGTALAEGYRGGGLDLVNDGGVVRMVFNGRLRLSELGAARDRRAVRTLLSSLRSDPIAEDVGPYGPFTLRFDLGPRLVPLIPQLDLLRGETFEAAQRTMIDTIDRADQPTFTRMNAELYAAFRFMVDVAEINPDLSFQELKLLIMDFATDDKPLDARGFVKKWQGAGAERRAELTRWTPAQLLFLLSGPGGQVFGDDDLARITGDVDKVRDVARRFVEARVTSAALRAAEHRRRRTLEALPAGMVPMGVRFASAELGAVAFGLARRDPAAFRARIVDRVVHGEDKAGPFVRGAVTVRPEQLDTFAREAEPSPAGLVERLEADRFDALAAVLDVELAEQGGLFGAPPAAIASKLLGRGVEVARIADDVDAALAAGPLGVVFDVGAASMPATAWGAPRLFGLAVRAEDLARCTCDGDLDALTEGLTNLANTLERAGAAASIVDDLTALKSRANRRAETDGGVADEAVEYLAANLTFDATTKGEPFGAAALDDGRVVFLVPADPTVGCACYHPRR